MSSYIRAAAIPAEAEILYILSFLGCIMWRLALVDIFTGHPSPDNPQKKNQNHNLWDFKIYKVDDVGYPKKQIAKSL